MKALSRSYACDEESAPHSLGELVRDPPLVVDVDAPIAEVRALLVTYRVPAVVVADNDDNLRGVITRTDVLRVEPGARARDAMSSFVLARPEEATVARAAALIACEGVNVVVVTGRERELVGLVSATDVVRYFAICAGTLRPD